MVCSVCKKRESMPSSRHCSPCHKAYTNKARERREKRRIAKAVAAHEVKMAEDSFTYSMNRARATSGLEQVVWLDNLQREMDCILNLARRTAAWEPKVK